MDPDGHHHDPGRHRHIYIAYGRFAKLHHAGGRRSGHAGLQAPDRKRWRIDELYRALFEKPFGWLSTQPLRRGENKVMVPLMNGVGDAAIRVGGVRRVQTGQRELPPAGDVVRHHSFPGHHLVEQLR
jgi:hypothetical protein